MQNLGQLLFLINAKISDAICQPRAYKMNS